MSSSTKIPLQWINGRLIPVMDTQLADFPGEAWKEIPGYDGFQLSNYGRVKSLGRVVNHGKTRYTKPDRILKLEIRLLGNNVLIQVKLKKPNAKNTTGISVSRFVYNLFVEPFDFFNNSIHVKKKDHDPLNLYYENLYLESVGMAYREPVNQYDKEGIFIHQYISMPEAAKATGTKVSVIRNAILKKRLQGKKYFWRRGEPLETIDVSKWIKPINQGGKSRARVVQQLTIEGEVIHTFGSITEAARKLGNIKKHRILNACADKNYSFLGYRWRYFDVPPGFEKIDGIKPFGNNIANVYGLPVNQYSITGEFVRSYDSASNASKETGFNVIKILYAIRKKVMVKEFFWTRGDPEAFLDISGLAHQIEQYYKTAKKPVQQLTIDGQLLETFDSIHAAANAIGVTVQTLTRGFKTANSICMGFRWRFVE